MTVDLSTLDAHEQPSDHLRKIWKGYSREDGAAILNKGDVDDLSIPQKLAEFQQSGSIPAEKIRTALSRLAEDDPSIAEVKQDAAVYHHPLIPGELYGPASILLASVLTGIQGFLSCRHCYHLRYRRLSCLVLFIET